MAQNRFPLGIATGPAFCNRKAERERLADNVLSGQHTLIHGPRRYGKTSLALQVLRELGRRKEPSIHSAACDFLIAHDAESVRDAVLEAVGRLTASVVPLHRRALKRVGRFFTQLKPEISVSASGAVLTFTPADPGHETIVEALKGLDKLAGDAGVRAVVLMDEFQQVGTLKRCRPIEAAIRHAAERAQHTSCVFSGSNRHLLTRMFEDRQSPLYRLCDRLTVNRIAASDYRGFIARAARTRWKSAMDEDAVEAIIDATRRHPHYVNLVCSRLWRRDAPPTVRDVEAVWAAYAEGEPNWLTREVSALSPNQRAVLGALASEPTRKPQSREFLERTRLAAASNAQAVKVLLERDLIYRDEEEWLRILDPALERKLRSRAS